MSTNRLVLNVQGMTCGHCKARVERALRDVDGVASVEVSLADHRATIAYDDAKVAPPALIAAVEDAGYDASA
jgi:copper chaperone